MTLDRETARALFGDAPTPTPATAGTAPAYVASTADASPFGDGPSVFERMQSRKSRKGMDWRLAAPVGVAALCIGAVALFALPRGDEAVEGKTVASAEIAPPPVAPAAPLTPEPAVATPTPEPVVTPTPAPTVQRAATTPRPAARRTTSTRVAAAPSAADAGSNVSATETSAPPPPSLGDPATVTLQPTQPAVTPTPVTPPVVEPQPVPQ